MDIRIRSWMAIQRQPVSGQAGMPTRKPSRILALSADAYEESIRKSLACGMTAHLAKPIEPDKLFAALVKYIVSAG